MIRSVVVGDQRRKGMSSRSRPFRKVSSMMPAPPVTFLRIKLCVPLIAKLCVPLIAMNTLLE